MRPTSIGWGGWARGRTQTTSRDGIFFFFFFLRKKQLEVELQEPERETRWAHDVALMYAHLDEKDEAFAWLEKAYTARAYDLLYFGVFPEWAGLRGNPRYRDLARRIGVTHPS